MRMGRGRARNEKRKTENGKRKTENAERVVNPYESRWVRARRGALNHMPFEDSCLVYRKSEAWSVVRGPWSVVRIRASS